MISQLTTLNVAVCASSLTKPSFTSKVLFLPGSTSFSIVSFPTKPSTPPELTLLPVSEKYAVLNLILPNLTFDVFCKVTFQIATAPKPPFSHFAEMTFSPVFSGSFSSAMLLEEFADSFADEFPDPLLIFELLGEVFGGGHTQDNPTNPKRTRIMFKLFPLILFCIFRSPISSLKPRFSGVHRYKNKNTVSEAGLRDKSESNHRPISRTTDVTGEKTLGRALFHQRSSKDTC